MTTRHTSLLHGLAGSLVVTVSLGVMSLFASDSRDFGARLVPALAMCGLALALVALLLRLRRRPWSFIGVAGGAAPARAFALGVAVVVASAILVFGGATVLGLVSWGPLDLPTLGVFLVTNTVIALLLEAIPEEVALRGYTQSSLAESFGRVLTVTLTTAFFVLAPLLLFTVQSVILSLTSGEWKWSFTPDGGDPAIYYIPLAIFGVTMSLARWATPTRSIGTSIRAHVAYLTVARIALSGDADATGWSMALLAPDAILVIPVLLVLAGVGFYVLGRRMPRHHYLHGTDLNPHSPSCSLAASTAGIASATSRR